ncbi:metal-dependent hydrolase [soil metagenome]
MPTIFSHAIFAILTGKAGLNKSVSFWVWFLTAVCAIIPDADVISFAFGVPYGSMFGHRGFTHSILFAAVFGGLIALIIHKFLNTGISFGKLLIFFSLVTFSHPVLDMLTDGGSGVALFAPFSGERFFFPFRPIEVSPIGMRFFSERGLNVILSETMWVWLPAFSLFLIAKFGRRFLKTEK